MTVPIRASRPAARKPAAEVPWIPLQHVAIIASCVVACGLVLTLPHDDDPPGGAHRCGYEALPGACRNAWPARGKRPERLAPAPAWTGR